MQKYKKPKFEYSDIGINPFRGNLRISSSILEFKDSYQMLEEGSLINATKIVDNTPSCRLFTLSNNRLYVSKLTLSGKELFLWIMFSVEPGKEVLWINKDRYMVENSTSINTYKRAIEDLVKNAVIAFTVVKDVYWINPLYFFNGDRLKMYPECYGE